MNLKSLVIVFALLSGSFSIVGADMIIPIVINKKVQQVVTVAKSKGDFTSISAAITSITDASANKKYVIFVAPGLYYSAKIIMKEYVSITGSGEDSTVITGFAGAGSLGEDAALVVGADNTSLTNLTIRNYGLNTKTYSTSLILNDKTMRIENITAESTGVSQNNHAIYIYSDNGSIVKNVTAKSIGAGAYNIAILVIGSNTSKVVFSNIDAYAANGTSTNHAIENSASKVLIRRSTLNAENSGSYGVKNFNVANTSTNISQSSILRRVTGDNIKCISCDSGAGGDPGTNCIDDVNGI